MRRKRTHLRLFAALALALSVTLASPLAQSAVAKKKKGGARVATVTGTTGAIPNGPTSFSPAGFANTNPVPFTGTATVGKAFKGKTVGDVDATLSLSGAPLPGVGCGTMCDLRVRLTPPNGAQTTLIFGGCCTGGVTGNLVSSLTLSDQTPTLTCGGPVGVPPTAPPPPCGDPDATLLAPYTGTAQPGLRLNLLNGSPIKGTWTLTAFDICGSTTMCGDQGTAAVISWSLRITPARAPR